MSANVAISFGLAHCLRGRGLFEGNRLACAWMWMVCAQIEAASIGYGVPLLIAIGVVVAAGGYLLLAPAIGAVFSAFNGNASYGGVPKWIDYLGWKLIPWALKPANRARGILQGMLRGLYGMPMFAALSLICGPYALLYGWAACLSKGLTYAMVRFVPNAGKYGVMAAEMIDGTIIGAAVYLSLVSGLTVSI